MISFFRMTQHKRVDVKVVNLFFNTCYISIRIKTHNNETNHQGRSQITTSRIQFSIYLYSYKVIFQTIKYLNLNNFKYIGHFKTMQIVVCLYTD